MTKTIPDKIIKYHKARLAGYNKKESKEIAGYSAKTTSVDVEQTAPYRAISVKDELLKHISLGEVAKRHADIIKNGDNNVALPAVKLLYDRVDPLAQVKDDDSDVVAITMTSK